jgi:hypothetical protein
MSVSRHSANCPTFELHSLCGCNSRCVFVRMCHPKCVSTSIILGKINKYVSVTVISSPVEQERNSGDGEMHFRAIKN